MPKTASVKMVNKGRIYVTATFNNTVVTVTDLEGNTLGWTSTGRSGFKGSRKATPYAANTTLEKALEVCRQHGLREIEVFIKGPGPGRDAALRVLRASGLRILLIADVTPIPHNGCRAKKRRRA